MPSPPLKPGSHGMSADERSSTTKGTEKNSPRRLLRVGGGITRMYPVYICKTNAYTLLPGRTPDCPPRTPRCLTKAPKGLASCVSTGVWSRGVYAPCVDTVRALEPSEKGEECS